MPSPRSSMPRWRGLDADPAATGTRSPQATRFASVRWERRSAGSEIVAWRGVDGTLHVGPGTCPHLGADLSTGTVRLRRADLPVARPATGRAAANSAGSPTRRTTTACWPGCGWTASAAKTRPMSRSCRPGPAARGCTRSRVWSARASRATSSPTGSIRGTAPGITRIRSRSSRCCPRRLRTTDLPEESGPLPGAGDVSHRPARGPGRRGVHQPGAANHRHAHHRRRRRGQRRRNARHPRRPRPRRAAAHAR